MWNDAHWSVIEITWFYKAVT